MIDRRHFLQLSGGAFVLPATGLGAVAEGLSGTATDRVIVFNTEYAECRSFAREALASGGTSVALTGEIGIGERLELYRSLLATPKTVLGMTTGENAFQIGMLAADAFHEQLVVETTAASAGQGPVSWVLAPVRERSIKA